MRREAAWAFSFGTLTHSTDSGFVRDIPARTSTGERDDRPDVIGDVIHVPVEQSWEKLPMNLALNVCEEVAGGAVGPHCSKKTPGFFKVGWSERTFGGDSGKCLYSMGAKKGDIF